MIHTNALFNIIHLKCDYVKILENRKSFDNKDVTVDIEKYRNP